MADPNYPGENVIAHNTLYHSKLYPSKITLPVVSKKELPEVKVIKEMEKAYPILGDKAVLEKMTKYLDAQMRKK